MADLEKLRVRGLRAYEAGRLRVAARIALYVSPAVALCWGLADDREMCGCLAVLLLGLAVWLRWRDRRGAEAVTTGLLAGSVPLVVGLLVANVLSSCGGPLCLSLSAAAGMTAGFFLATRERRSDSSTTGWLAAGAIASLAASLGCVSLGVLGMVGAVTGVVLGGGLGALVPTAR